MKKASSLEKSALDVCSVSVVPLDVLRAEIAQAIRGTYPDNKTVTNKVFTFKNGMIIVHGSTGGLPVFGEIVQICVVQQNLCFIAKRLCGWYREHFRAVELTESPTRDVFFVDFGDLVDTYPLEEYMVGPFRMVTLKRHVHV